MGLSFSMYKMKGLDMIFSEDSSSPDPGQVDGSLPAFTAPSKTPRDQGVAVCRQKAGAGVMSQSDKLMGGVHRKAERPSCGACWDLS